MRTSRSEQAKWEKQYSQLQSYYKKQGHSRVPSSLHNDLSEWVQHQRVARRKGTLSQEKIGRLDQIDFYWGKKAAKKVVAADNFDEMHQQLQAFYDKKGHTRAPLTSNLGVWCQKQRTKLRDNTMSAEHRARLEEIHFDYEATQPTQKKAAETAWDKNCTLLAAFYQDHGHYVIPKNHALSHWVASQRKAHQQGRLKKERKQRLEQIQFVWTEAAAVQSRRAWEDNFCTLQRFRQKKGHSFVQRHDDIPLWRWTEKNDWKQRRGTLPRKHYERLASIGFWDAPPENLSERGELTQDDHQDVAYVARGGTAAAAAAAAAASASGAESDDEEEQDAGDNYQQEDDDDDDEVMSEEEDEEEEEELQSPRAKRNASRNKKRQANNNDDEEEEEEDSKPRARKRRMRRSSTFDDDEGFSTRYQVGTKVMKWFDEHGWFQGEIISIYEQNVYKIRYEDDDEETYLMPNEQKDLDQIVTNADLLRHEVGTNVKKMFEGYGWFEGKVVAREEDRYQIRYNDGDKEEYLFHELAELDEIVANARSQ